MWLFLPMVVVTALAIPARSARAFRRPNVVVILTDDQRFDELAPMPETRRLLVSRGVKFENAFVVNSLCCPSRASILTGNYSHTTGVYTNGGLYGGFGAFDDRSTLATWLHDAGYHTGLIGKYLNGYKGTYIPPGWDRWVAIETNSELKNYYYDYELNIDGTIHSYGEAPSDYSTDVLADDAVRFIDNHRSPLFLYFAPWAPHAPAIPPDRYRDTYSSLPPYRPPSFDEPDVSDKPQYIRDRPQFTPDQIQAIDDERRAEYGATRGVDDAVGRIVAALRDSHRLRNTLFVFLTDNGKEWGEHRWTNKQVPYEESIRVPFIVRYDRLGFQPRTEKKIALNIDIAPTIAAAAHTSTPGTDGRSFLGLLTDPSVPWRASFLIEHLHTGGTPNPPTYCAIRTRRYLYVVYETKERELYDLRSDPYELLNRARVSRLAAERHKLRRKLRHLCTPRPPGYDAL